MWWGSLSQATGEFQSGCGEFSVTWWGVPSQATGDFQSGCAYSSLASMVLFKQLKSVQVWDYASDGYVHRLVQSKTDGKLVEVPSPAPPPTHSTRPASE